MKHVAKFLKIIAFIWFFISGQNALMTVFGAAEDGQLGLSMSYLVFQWLIALSLYFAGDFIRRVSNAEERFARIVKQRRNKK